MEHRLNDFGGFISKLPAQERHEVRFYDDALEFIAMKQDEAHRMELIEKRLPDGAENAIFESLLKTRLYPYQKQGALFAARAGRCLIGDDMGLGKTIQALAAVELMAGLFGISKVLIVSPTSLKYQWLSEINKFTGRTAQVIEGMSHKHKSQFETTSFYKLINYELVSRDVKAINDWAPDLIILDEAQRIKNWQTRTAKTIKSLQSQFAIVLTGTPVENKIEELHSIVEFIDMHHLGPLYRFVHDHRITEGGSSKVVGYKNLDRIRKSLEGVMIRRKKSEVLKQLPERIDKIFSVPMTKEQADIHEENREVVARLAMKWRRYRFLSDADLRRMQIALANMRMVSDNTYLIDARTNHGPKIDELEILVKELVVEAGEKAVIFSQWIRMNTLIEEVLNKNGVGFVHLNGNVPSKDRKELMNRFKNDPSCRVFLSTDAGGVGLNLQSGSIVINMDVPWNPAVLEQRIGRVHRMGQKNSVRVINFVTKGSIEERILDLIQFKKALFAGALDIDGADFVEVGKSGLEGFMKTVEEATVNLEKDPSQIIDDALKPEEEVVTQEKDEPVEISAVTSGQPDFTGFISGINPEKIQNFLLAGARFMDSLASAINKDDNVATVNYNKIIERAGNLIVKDESTGGDCLKIPIPKPQVINELASAFGAVISSLLK
jgi:SNF2 family DNA or RNA helicase